MRGQTLTITGALDGDLVAGMGKRSRGLLPIGPGPDTKHPARRGQNRYDVPVFPRDRPKRNSRIEPSNQIRLLCFRMSRQAMAILIVY